MTAPGKHQQKRWASRRFRKRVKQVLKPFRYSWNIYIVERECYLGCKCEDVGLGNLCLYQDYNIQPEFPHPKWMTDPVTVCDFRFYSPWDEGAYRK